MKRKLGALAGFMFSSLNSMIVYTFALILTTKTNKL